MWWKDFVENSHNRLARELVTAERTDLWDAARLLALINMSVMDAYIVVFENKFFYNHWRPYTAIRWSGDDGNPATQADPQWQNTHGHTYASECALSRVYLGIHFRYDSLAGNQLGARVGHRAVERYLRPR